MRRQALPSRVIDPLLQVVGVSHGDGSQSHQRAISVIEPVPLLRVLSLLLHELVHRDRDVPPEADRVRPAAVVEPVLQPQNEQVPHVGGVEDKIVEKDAVGHAKAHRCIVSPYCSLPRTVQRFQVRKTLLHYPQPLLTKVVEFRTRTQSVTDAHAQNRPRSSRLPQRESQLRRREIFAVLHLLEDGCEPEPVLVVRGDDAVHAVALVHVVAHGRLGEICLHVAHHLTEKTDPRLGGRLHVGLLPSLQGTHLGRGFGGVLTVFFVGV